MACKYYLLTLKIIISVIRFQIYFLRRNFLDTILKNFNNFRLFSIRSNMNNVKDTKTQRLLADDDDLNLQI